MLRSVDDLNDANNGRLNYVVFYRGWMLGESVRAQWPVPVAVCHPDKRIKEG